MGVVRRASQVVALIASLFGAVSARAQIGCAGDGAPERKLELSAFVSGQVSLFSGDDAELSHGDAAQGRGNYSGAEGLAFRFARVALCGRLPSRFGTWVYDVGYQPWSLYEQGQPDPQSWGRISAAEIGFWPWHWLGFYVGVRKVLLSYGHDEPLQALALPIRPYIDTSVAPDRRAGLTIDDDFGAAHIRLGVYQGARNLLPTEAGGLLVAARLVAEPIGPVGPRISTVDDPPYWRHRARFDFNASILYEWMAEDTGYAIGGDLGFKYGPLGLVVEYLKAHNTFVEGPTPAPRARDSRQGLWAEGALMLIRPWLELTARYDWMDEPGDPLQQFHAVTGGLNVYAYRTLARAQVVYTHKFHLGGVGADDDVALLVLSLATPK